jgi:hypothetical protein
MRLLSSLCPKEVISSVNYLFGNDMFVVPRLYLANRQEKASRHSHSVDTLNTYEIRDSHCSECADHSFLGRDAL